MSFDPNGPDNLTSDQKLYNIKKRIGEIRRTLRNEEEFAVEEDALHIIHMMMVVLADIEKEIDRTV